MSIVNYFYKYISYFFKNERNCKKYKRIRICKNCNSEINNNIYFANDKCYCSEKCREYYIIDIV